MKVTRLLTDLSSALALLLLNLLIVQNGFSQITNLPRSNSVMLPPDPVVNVRIIQIGKNASGIDRGKLGIDFYIVRPGGTQPQIFASGIALDLIPLKKMLTATQMEISETILSTYLRDGSGPLLRPLPTIAEVGPNPPTVDPSSVVFFKAVPDILGAGRSEFQDAIKDAISAYENSGAAVSVSLLEKLEPIFNYLTLVSVAHAEERSFKDSVVDFFVGAGRVGKNVVKGIGAVTGVTDVLVAGYIGYEVIQSGCSVQSAISASVGQVIGIWDDVGGEEWNLYQVIEHYRRVEQEASCVYINGVLTI